MKTLESAMRLVLLILLSAGALWAQPGEEQQVIQATIQGDAERVQKLLRSGADPNQRDPEGQTALLFSAFYGHLEVTRVLLENGAEVDARAGSGPTALILAANKGNLEIASLLLAKGADVNAAQEDGGTALIEATQEGGNLELIRLLIDSGADVRAKKKSGFTALILASTRGELEVMKLLLKSGAEPNPGPGEFPPLLFAVQKGHVDAARLLLENGADPEAEAPNGQLIRELAEERGGKMSALFGHQQAAPRDPAGGVTIEVTASEYSSLFSCESGSLQPDEVVLYTSSSQPLTSLGQLSGSAHIGFSPDLREDQAALTFARCLTQLLESEGKESTVFRIVAGGSWERLFTEHQELLLFVVPIKHLALAETTIAKSGGGIRLRFRPPEM